MSIPVSIFKVRVSSSSKVTICSQSTMTTQRRRRRALTKVDTLKQEMSQRWQAMGFGAFSGAHLWTCLR